MRFSRATQPCKLTRHVIESNAPAAQARGDLPDLHEQMRKRGIKAAIGCGTHGFEITPTGQYVRPDIGRHLRQVLRATTPAEALRCATAVGGELDGAIRAEWG